MKAWNWDKLSASAKALLVICMETISTGWTPTYMIEVRLDSPIYNLMIGETTDKVEVLHRHGGNGSRDYAHYYFDPNWAVVHEEDDDIVALKKSGDWISMLAEATEIIDEMDKVAPSHAQAALYCKGLDEIDAKNSKGA